MAPSTPSLRPSPANAASTSHQTTPSKTPHQIKHRLQFHTPRPTAGSVPTEHPVEVIGRIRDGLQTTPALEVAPDGRSIRVPTDIGYRDFTLDGVSISETEDLDSFYRTFVGSRVEGVKSGAKCTVMMYGPTGSGKSHTMFGCAKQPGILYRALRDILGSGRDNDAGFGMGIFVQVAVLEVYNEETYDLLSGNVNGGAGLLPKGSTPKVKLEVMGKKAKNATYLCGNEAGKLSRELMKVEKRRIVKSTLCNERSSRSHCMIILDVPAVGGRLMLVDMAGSENIDQAGQTGLEAKMQTAKINQGNIALKRVVECIANGDSHVPFRDSKLTMLLQDSFEDDKSKILMILCASPDPKELHKTISTLEYGAKAKCIVRAAHIPTPKDRFNSEDSSILLRSRIEAMNQFIHKLQMENKLKDKELDYVNKELMKKEEVTAQLRARICSIEETLLSKNEQEVESKVEEKTQSLKTELVKMEEKMLRQQEEMDMLRKRLEEIESSKSDAGDCKREDFGGGKFMRRLTELYSEGDQSMVQSMELDMGDQTTVLEVKEIKEDHHRSNNNCNGQLTHDSHPDRICLSAVFETDYEGEERDGSEDGEVEKGVVEESTPCGNQKIADFEEHVDGESGSRNNCKKHGGVGGLFENVKDIASSRSTRIQNIFRLCGNQREISQQVNVNTAPKDFKDAAKELNEEKKLAVPEQDKENCWPGGEGEGLIEVYVKWEVSMESIGNVIKIIKVLKTSTLSDLRKLIETHLEEEKKQQPFAFLLLADPLGAPVRREEEAAVPICKLPTFNNHHNARLACLRRVKNSSQKSQIIPFSSVEKKLLVASSVAEGLSPAASYLTELSMN